MPASHQAAGGTTTATAPATPTPTGPAATAPATATAPPATAPRPRRIVPRGLQDLRGRAGGPLLLCYPAGAVVVVSGLPGSGKSTLLGRWSGAARAVDPRAAHLACEAVMPGWLPYPVYRPWARLRHFGRLTGAARAGRPLLVHDCGSSAWLRRWLAWNIRRQRREVHLVLLDVGAAQALEGQRARGRFVRRRVFARHRRGLAGLLAAIARSGRAAVPEAGSVLLLDLASRGRPTAVEFAAPPTGADRPVTGTDRPVTGADRPRGRR